MNIRHRLMLTGVALALTATLSACGGSSKAAAPTTTSTAVAAPTTSTTVSPTTTTSTTVAPATTTTTTSLPAGNQPTLGLLTGLFADGGAGWGQVEPKQVFNGGDPTGDVTDIIWSSWGGPQAEGTGMSDYVSGNESVAGGTQEPVHIVAFELGNCNGHYMYAAVEWYFAQHGGGFDPSAFEDACIGYYYPVMPGTFEDGGNDGGQGHAHYVIDLTASPALKGAVQSVTATGQTSTLFNFDGVLQINGTFDLDSTGPADNGRPFDGTWGEAGLTLTGCDTWLPTLPGATAPSCTFVQ